MQLRPAWAKCRHLCAVAHATPPGQRPQLQLQLETNTLFACRTTQLGGRTIVAPYTLPPLPLHCFHHPVDLYAALVADFVRPINLNLV